MARLSDDDEVAVTCVLVAAEEEHTDPLSFFKAAVKRARIRDTARWKLQARIDQLTPTEETRAFTYGGEWLSQPHRQALSELLAVVLTGVEAGTWSPVVSNESPPDAFDIAAMHEWLTGQGLRLHGVVAIVESLRLADTLVREYTPPEEKTLAAVIAAYLRWGMAVVAEGVWTGKTWIALCDECGRKHFRWGQYGVGKGRKKHLFCSDACNKDFHARKRDSKAAAAAKSRQREARHEMAKGKRRRPADP